LKLQDRRQGQEAIRHEEVGRRGSGRSGALAAGVSLWAVADILGHASTAITGEVYRHELPAALRDATEQVAKRIFEVSSAGSVNNP
jgi:integrase